jgi:hypothetical protein
LYSLTDLTPDIYADDVSKIGKFFNIGDGIRIGVIVAKGAYANLAAAQTALVGKVLTYQLATPIVSEPKITNPITSVPPGGSIYCEGSINGYMNFLTGETKKVVTDANYPISTIRKVYRLDMSAGYLQKVDVTATATITDSGTSITLSSVVVGAAYFYDCEPVAGYSTAPFMSLTYTAENGTASHDYAAAAADWVLTSNEAKAKFLSCTNAGGAAKIIAPGVEGKIYFIKNASGQTLTVKTSSSTGITIANGKTATVIYFGTDFIKIGEI